MGGALHGDSDHPIIAGFNGAVQRTTITAGGAPAPETGTSDEDDAIRPLSDRLITELNWVCVSPKSSATLQLRKGDELKLVFPQQDAPPEIFEQLDFNYFELQPMDGPDRALNTKLAA